MNSRPTLHLCPPNMRAETLREIAKRMNASAVEWLAFADCLHQLGLVPIAVELRDIHAKADAARLSVLGAAR